MLQYGRMRKNRIESIISEGNCMCNLARMSAWAASKFHTNIATFEMLKYGSLIAKGPHPKSRIASLCFYEREQRANELARVPKCCFFGPL